jgi:hypothetical protein
MVVTSARGEKPTKVGRSIAGITRVAAALAVVTQTVLLGLGLTWAVREHQAISDVAGRQGGIFAASVLLAAVVFWLTGQRDSANTDNRIGA